MACTTWAPLLRASRPDPRPFHHLSPLVPTQLARTTNLGEMAAGEAAAAPADPQQNGAKLTAAQRKKLKAKQRKQIKKVERCAIH